MRRESGDVTIEVMAVIIVVAVLAAAAAFLFIGYSSSMPASGVTGPAAFSSKTPVSAPVQADLFFKGGTLDLGNDGSIPQEAVTSRGISSEQASKVRQIMNDYLKKAEDLKEQNTKYSLHGSYTLIAETEPFPEQGAELAAQLKHELLTVLTAEQFEYLDNNMACAERFAYWGMYRFRDLFRPERDREDWCYVESSHTHPLNGGGSSGKGHETITHSKKNLKYQKKLKELQQADAKTAPVSIRTVRTWEDLLKQPAVDIGTGTARLGIEALRAPYTSGVLLYCMTEGWSPPHTWNEPSRLGPFTVEVRHEQETPGFAAQTAQTAVWPDAPDTKRSIMLFRRTVPLYRPGKFHIRVCTLNRETAAEASVTATREKFHAWTVLEQCTGKPEQRKNDTYDAVAFARNRAQAIALPRYEGMKPLFYTGDGRGIKIMRKKRETLPPLFPKKSTDTAKCLALSARGTDLTVQSREEIILARPDWHFLVRWWVNGKPFIPEQISSFSDQNGMVIQGRKLLLHLDFIPKRIGAKQGDRVDLQLLYCRDGWTLLHPAEMMSASHDMQGPDMLLSDRVRIEWETDEKRTDK